MYLVKASTQVLDTVRKKNRQLFRGEPRGWEAGESVLFTRNKGDLEEGEKPIAVSARIVKIRPVEGNEATDLGSGAGGQFKFVAEYEAVTELAEPFELEDAIGADAADNYKRVTIARKVEPADAKALAARLPATSEAGSKASSSANATAASPAPQSASAAATLAGAATAKTAPAKSAPKKAEPAKPAAAKAPPAKDTPPPQSASSAASLAKAAASSKATAAPAKADPAKSSSKESQSATAPKSARSAKNAHLPWYLATIEISRLSLGFFIVGAFLLGAVVSW